MLSGQVGSLGLWLNVEVQACTKGGQSPVCEYWLGYSVYKEDLLNILFSKNKKFFGTSQFGKTNYQFLKNNSNFVLRASNWANLVLKSYQQLLWQCATQDIDNLRRQPKSIDECSKSVQSEPVDLPIGEQHLLFFFFIF